jgi:hypothetical protein
METIQRQVAGSSHIGRFGKFAIWKEKTMARLRFVAGLVMAPLAAITLANMGCGGGEKKAETTKSSGARASSTSGGGGVSGKTEKTELKPVAFATIKGKVTYNGTLPTPADIAIPDTNTDKSYCLKGPHKDQTWVVGPDKGVANVVIWVKPPKDKYFVVPDDQQKPAESVVKIDQPYCAFEPHVAILFPTFYDPQSKHQKPTGQVFEIDNSAPITHNTNWTPEHPLISKGDNKKLSPKEKLDITLNAAAPNRTEGEDMTLIKCNIHTWMRAYVWAFTNPWAAVTKADGTYEIKKVPAGSELYLVAWHEPGEYELPQGNGTRDGMKIGPLKEGETKDVDFTVSKSNLARQNTKAQETFAAR